MSSNMSSHPHPQSEKLLNALPALCNIVRRCAITAGEITLDYFDGIKELKIETKDNGSPVSLADKEAEEHIIRVLSETTPDIPAIGEENHAEGQAPDISSAEYFWLIDALDGTKAFIAGDEDFTVNIALIHKDTPILGVVYVPAAGILYAGHKDGPAIKWNQDTGKEKQIGVRQPPTNGLTVVSSKSHGNTSRFDHLLEDFKIRKIIRHASSLKTCLIAEAKADIYPRLGPTCEWDIAACHAVLKAAGGCIVDLNGDELTYGHTDRDLLNPEFIASSVNWLKTEEGA